MLNMKFGIGLFFVFFAVVRSQRDRTRENGTYGSDVVEGVMSALRDACIFPDDKLFLRRIAYVESKDGASSKTYRDGYNGGIWQVDETMFNETKTKLGKSFYATVTNKLGIDWSNVTWSDLRKPLYSGLAAAMYLLGKGAPWLIPSAIDEQEQYWKSHYKPTGTDGTFVPLSKELDLGCHKDEQVDLLFLIDTTPNAVFDSSHITTFMKNYIQSLHIDHDHAQIAVESYGADPKVDIPLGSYSTKQSLLNAISALTINQGTANLPKALQLASGVFMSNKGSRTNAAKTIILFSSTPMQMSYEGILASIKLKNQGVSIYTVGTGLNSAALGQIASAPACAHTYTVADFRRLEALHPYVARTSCRVAVGLQPGEYKYPCGSNVLVRVQSSSVGATVKVHVTNGTAEVFGSYVSTQPSKDLNDVNHTVTPTQSVSIFIRDQRPLTLAVNTEHRHLASCYGDIKITVDPSVSKRTECQDKNPDIILLLDSSKNKSESDFQNMKEFASRFASQFKIGADAAQIGLVTYADKASNRFWLNTFNTQESLQRAIRIQALYGNKSNLAMALKYIREEALQPINGERQHSSKVLVVVTGSPAQNAVELLREAHLIQNEGVRVVVVAVGEAAKDPIIQGTASGLVHLQKLSGYNDLPGAAGKAVVESCGDVQLVCMENGLQRNCRIEDLLASQFASLIVPEHGAIPNSPCSIRLPVPLPIQRFPHPTDKDKFILCDNHGQSYLVLCPLGEVFNAVLTECELPTSPRPSTPPTLTSGAPFMTLPAASPSTPSSTATLPSSSNPCSGETISQGLYFHPYIPDPHKFIHCTGMPNASNLESCPAMKIWRQASVQCENEYLTDEMGKAITSLPNPCMTGTPGFFPHPFDKNSYIQCDAWGEGFLKKCQSGLVFVPVQDTCERPPSI
ncbi:collagen alpha-6(VI) chain-like [Haliotis cracherodii]|uniref:collagen alpha-6(VI) chain-like n=1 Tax=Haliotis cracherodii TaxID=6455 RepID=UPI0039E87BBB